MSNKTRQDTSAYPTAPEPQDALEVALAIPSGNPVPGEVANVSSLGATVLFARMQAPCLAMGESVDLMFSSVSLGKRFNVKADAVGRSELESGRQYSFKFPKQLLLHDPRLHRLFNRRAAYRVTPRENEVIEARIESTDDNRFPDLPSIRCRDVSEEGICLETGIEADAVLKGSDAIYVCFQVPHSTAALKLLGSIVNRRITEGTMIMGIKFDVEGTRRFTAQQQEIIKYVMRRQREELQQTAHARA